MIARLLRSAAFRVYDFADSFGNGNITEIHLAAFYVGLALDLAATRLTEEVTSRA